MTKAIETKTFDCAMAHTEGDLGRDTEAERLLGGLEPLVNGDGKRQSRAQLLDSSSDKPAGRKRLRPLHVPAGRGAIAEAGLEGVMCPFAGEAGVPERQFGFHRRDARAPIGADCRTLTRPQPSALRDGGADAEPDEGRDAAACDYVCKAWRVDGTEHAP